MSSINSKDILRYALVGGLAIYVYKKVTDKGETMAGNPEKIASSILPWLSINPILMPFASAGIKAMSKSMFSPEENHEVLNAKYRRIK